MALAFDTIDGRGLSNEVHYELLPKKSKCICRLFHSKSRLTSCTLLTRWSTSVLKVGLPCGYKAYKKGRPIVSKNFVHKTNLSCSCTIFEFYGQ